MRILSILLLAVVIFGCDSEPTVGRCGTPATVRDLRGLEGCGFVFELQDGRRLEPQFIGWCGTPPLSQEQIQDPLNDFEFVDGKKVTIGYEVLKDIGSICMVGDVVKITCLEEVGNTEDK